MANFNNPKPPQRKHIVINPFEIIRDSIKTIPRQVVDTVNPARPFFETLASSEIQKREIDNKNNHTPLDFDKLGKAYEQNEDMEALRLARLYLNRVQDADKKMLLQKKKEKEEKERQEELLKQEQARKKEEEKKRSAESELPRGKVRRSIFSFGKIRRKATTAYENKGQFGR